MARDLTPITKRSRREKVSLHPKSDKIMIKRNYAPGEHGTGGGRNKPSQYSMQLREKQKVKRTYGLLEKQFATLVGKATRQAGVAGENLLQLLEMRLDNVVYRLGFAPSRQSARQLVTHGHLRLNDHGVDIPSILVRPGDEITVRASSRQNKYFQTMVGELPKQPTLPGWLSLDTAKLSAKVTGSPTRDEIDQEINEQLIIEFYSR